MNRYEITNSMASQVTVDKIVEALKKAGAIRVNTRRAFGYSNQRKVATFSAKNQSSAKAVCEIAGDSLGIALIPYRYTGGKWVYNPNTNLSHFVES